jgi:hypothetical protein
VWALAWQCPWMVPSDRTAVWLAATMADVVARARSDYHRTGDPATGEALAEASRTYMDTLTALGLTPDGRRLIAGAGENGGPPDAV